MIKNVVESVYKRFADKNYLKFSHLKVTVIIMYSNTFFVKVCSVTFPMKTIKPTSFPRVLYHAKLSG